jgi:hypothetical protein
MNASEALTRLIQCADEQIAATQGSFSEQTGEEPEIAPELEELQVAVAVSQAMLNMMLPVARYRCHVEVDAQQQKRSPGQQKLAAHSEFTSCSASMEGIKSSLVALSTVDTEVRVTVFEQRATGADMLVGYQGKTKNQRFRTFLDQLTGIEAAPTIN